MDIVIPVKRAYINEELRYTLRSICKNFSHRKIWISGYLPPWVTGPVGHIEAPYPPGSKYKKVVANNIAACRDQRISENFYLFNDDFFVMKPVEKFENYHRGPISESLERLRAITAASFYMRSLALTERILKDMGIKEPMDYGLHIPIVINRVKWMEAWKKQLELNPHQEVVHMRTIYGNMNKLASKRMDDIKILSLEKVPTGEETFLSTVDSSFHQGRVGQYVRKRFLDPCQCEGATQNTFMLK